MKKIRQILYLYTDGFHKMSLGKGLWTIILLKLFIMFFVIKTFFFNENLNKKFSTDEQKYEYVIKNLTKEK
jgi:hypothetical protein